MKSYNKPTNEELDRAIPLLSSPQHEAYFFSHLENPMWITPLAERDLFKHPPKPEHAKGGLVRFPPWPASRYLARMARHAPAEVATIFARIETDNLSVVGDILTAALAMPPRVAVSLVPAVFRVAQEDRLWIYFKEATDFCLTLAEGDQPDAAMTLAKALFAPSFENGQQKRNREDQHWYKEGLEKIVPVLAARRPHEFLRTLCGWLKLSIEAKRQADQGADYSDLWRPAIEEHEQNPGYDFAGNMVGFVRGGFEQAIRNGSLSLQASLEIVGYYDQVIFKRIGVHLIGEFAEQNPDLTRETILNRSLFDDYRFKHEYAMLVGRRLDLLSAEQREQWFGWIDAGPNMSDFDQSMKNLRGAIPTQEDRQAWVQDWQFEKLHGVRAHLEGARKDFYEKRVRLHGEPELADINVSVSGGFMANETPMTVEQLAAMTFDQAVDAISSWRPEGSRFTGPSITGLASTFEQYVATKPQEFSLKARILINRPAIFVRTFLHQLAESIKAGCEFDLSAVLDLCDWVTQRPIEERTIGQQMRERLVDQSWQWTRDEISRLIGTVCTAKNGDAPRYALDGLRQRMWRLIASLSRDTAESYIIHDISEDDPRLHDYLDIAINSPRGKAIEAGLEYARWVANHIKVSEGKQEIIAGGFNAMHEVREMLDWQIASENRTFEGLAAIGSRIGMIYWIDKQWLAQNANRLFSLEDIEKGPVAAHGWAAWNAFLVWVRPHFEFYQIFKTQFAYAVSQSEKVTLPELSGHQPMQHLGEHLVIMFARGQLGLDDDDGIFRRFLEYTNPDIRRYTIGFIGQSLNGIEKVPKEIIERCQALWDLYWTGPGRKDAEESPNAWLFGMWFSCGKFPESWALERLQQFVRVNPTPEPDHLIAERLAEVADVDVARSVCILDQVVRGDREGWRIQGWLDSAKQILRAALRTTGEAREVAIRLVDYLGRRGYSDFGQLMKG